MPDHVCRCDNNGRPQCADSSMIFMTHEAYPGETITISTIIVDGDFGATVGAVYISFLGYDHQSSHKVSQCKTCTNISYQLRIQPKNDSNTSYSIMHLSISPYDSSQFFQPIYADKDDVKGALKPYIQHR